MDLFGIDCKSLTMQKTTTVYAIEGAIHSGFRDWHCSGNIL